MRSIRLSGTCAGIGAALAVLSMLFGCAGAPKAKKPPAVTGPPMDAASLYRRGVANFDARRYDDAIADLTLAVERGGKNPDIYSTRGRAFFEKGKIPEAIADAGRAIEIAPRYDTAYNTRGYYYYASGKYDLALADFDKTLSLNPRHEAAFNHRGLVRAARGEYDLAIADFTRAVNIDPDYYEVYWNKAAACEKAGRTKEALEAYGEYVRRAPPRESAKVAQARERIKALTAN